MPFLIKPVVRPNCLDGQDNGRLDPSILSPIPSERATGMGYQMALPAARAYRAMHAAAKAKGLTLKPVSASDTYRPYGVQLSIYNQRYAVDGSCGGCKTCAGFGRRCKKKQANGLCPATAACPGTSNHGWGLAVDIGVETDGDVAAESIGTASNPTPELTWLGNNADLFGFSWESLPEEFWHLRHYRGDDLSAAVLAYEASLEPEPLPTPTGDDLLLTRYQCTDADAAFISLNSSNHTPIFVAWADAATDAAYVSAIQVREDVPRSAFKTLILIGTLPVGDSRHQWTAADFRQWVPAA